MSHITPPDDLPGPRNPRIHRQSGIPSISRPRGGTPSPKPNNNPYLRNNFDDEATPKPSNTRFNRRLSISKPSSGKKSKALGFQFLSKNRGESIHDSDKLSPGDVPGSSYSSPSNGRRIASMPPSTLHQTQLQAQLDIGSTRGVDGIKLGSPPIVDFTRFEDMYRSPRNGTFEGLISSHRTPKPKTRLGVAEVHGASGSQRGSAVKNRSSSTGVGVKPALKTETPVPLMLDRRSTTARFSVPGCGGGGSASGMVDTPQPASERKPDPRLVLAAVVDILGLQAQVEEYLNTHKLLAAHQLDQLDFEERDAVHAGFIECGRLRVKGRKGALVVLGEPLRRTALYSSTTMVLGGRDHILPIVVVNCVEELYRTGIYQPQLFRTLPNRARLLELIKIFDSEHPIPGSVIRSRQPKGSVHAHTILIPNAGFGTNTSLHLESTPDICALLTTYLSSLSEPVLPPFLFRAIWDWCGLDDDDDDDDEEENLNGGNGHETSGNLKTSSSFSRRQGLPSPIPLSKTYTSLAESTHISLAQLLLHLMPSPNFSLLVYLLAFFSQVALVREENGVGVDDLSRMFGGRIFGGGSMPSSGSSASLCASASSSNVKRPGQPPSDRSEAPQMNEDVFNTTQTRREGETMMSWFLRRWAPISEGLFDVVDDAKMGLFRRTMARKDSLGEDVLSGWLTGSVVGSGAASSGTPVEERTHRDGEPVDIDDEDDVYRDCRCMEERRRKGKGVADERDEESADISPDGVDFHRSTILPPSIRIDMAPQGHSTPNSKRVKSESWLRARNSESYSEYDGADDEEEMDEEEKMDERARLAQDSDQEEIDIVDDYILLSSSTTPTPAAMTDMRSNPLEIDDTLDIVRISSTPMIQIGSPGAREVSPGDERLMDISMPIFLNQTLPNHNELDLNNTRSSSSSASRRLRDIGVQTKPFTSFVYQPDDSDDNASRYHEQNHNQQQLAQALESVSHLERQLRNCTDLVSDTLKELDVSRRESYVRARRIVELENALAEGGDLSTISTISEKGNGKRNVSDLERNPDSDVHTSVGVGSQTESQRYRGAGIIESSLPAIQKN